MEIKVCLEFKVEVDSDWYDADSPEEILEIETDNVIDLGLIDYLGTMVDLYYKQNGKEPDIKMEFIQGEPVE